MKEILLSCFFDYISRTQTRFYLKHLSIIARAGKDFFHERRCESDEMFAHLAARFKAGLENPVYTGRLYDESSAMGFALHLHEKHLDFSQKLKLPMFKTESRNLHLFK